MVYTIWYIPIASWYIPFKSGIYHEATFQMARRQWQPGDPGRSRPAHPRFPRLLKLMLKTMTLSQTRTDSESTFKRQSCPAPTASEGRRRASPRPGP